MLAQALDGQTAQRPQPSQEQIAALVQEREQVAARRAFDMAERQAALADWQAFEASAPEFLNTPGMRQRLLVEIQIAADGRRPTAADIQAAYKAACEAHPEVRAVLAQREEAKRAEEVNRRGRSAAGVSIRNQPAGPVGTVRAKNTEEEVSRQWDLATRGRI
jgi:hypothetical protein